MGYRYSRKEIEHYLYEVQQIQSQISEIGVSDCSRRNLGRLSQLSKMLHAKVRALLFALDHSSLAEANQAGNCSNRGGDTDG